VFKATYSDAHPPKPKHVEALLDLSQRIPSLDLMGYIERRFSIQEWNVVLKTLILIHKLTLEGNVSFFDNLSKRKSLAKYVGHYMDDRAEDSRGHSLFIRLYNMYLTEKITTYKKLKVSHERSSMRDLRNDGPKWTESLSLPQFCSALSILQRHFDRLLDCKPYTFMDSTHVIALKAVELLIRDGYKIYFLLGVMMLFIIDKFQTMNLTQTELILTCCQHYQDQNTRFQAWATSLNKLGLDEPVEEFAKMPPTFISLISGHLSALRKKEKKGGQPEKKETVNSKKKDKTKAKKSNSNEEEDESEDEVEVKEEPKKK